MENLLFYILASGWLYFLIPSVQLEKNELALLGDSLAVGTSSQDIRPWPALYSDRTGIRILNLAKCGARAEDGLEMADRIPDDDLPVLLELGGNDWRRKRDRKEELYEKGLNNLLKKLTASGRQVIMFEMPFPSYDWRFISTQRRLARKHHVILIPRKFIADVMFGEDGLTIDGIHLSRKGHERFARKLENLLSHSSVSVSL